MASVKTEHAEFVSTILASRAQSYFPALGDASNEWAILRVEDPAYRWKGSHEHRSNITASQVTGDKDKYAGAACSQSGDLERTIPQALIFREDDPLLLSDRSQPDTILFIALEVVIVDLNGQTFGSQGTTDRFNAQGPVDEQDSAVRRLRSGSLLRRHLSPIGNPERVQRRSHPPYTARKLLRQESRCQRSQGGRRTPSGT